MKLDLYARTSTKDQDVDMQMSLLRQWCINNNHKIASETYDQESGTKELYDRIKFKELLLNPRGEAMLIFKLDRITRNFDSLTLIEKHFRENWNNYKLICTDMPIDLETAVGRLMFRNLMVINCFEPEQMKERQKPAIEKAKAKGLFKGRKKGSKNKTIGKCKLQTSKVESLDTSSAEVN